MSGMRKHDGSNTISPMRLLGVIRLSKETDETTSPERQRLAIEQWAAARGHRIIGWAEDLDVSGAVEPADRPELGPWLRRAKEWDALIVHKPDRLSRSLRDFLNLWHELDKQDKTLISVNPEFDLSTDTGRLVANILLSFAQFERDMISSRVKDAHRHIKVNGGYPGGPVPFGYMPVKRDSKGWEYQQDPEYAGTVRQMAEKILDGMSLRQVAIWLNDSQIPTSRNIARRRNGKPERRSQWATQTVKEVLLNPAIAGMHASGDKPLRDSDGFKVQRCEGIISRQEWELVKLAIAGPEHRTYRVDANPLLRVAFCLLCGSPLYPTSTTQKGERYTYYRCSKQAADGRCESKSFPAGWLAKTAAQVFLMQVGDHEIGHWDIEPADDHQQELREVIEAIADLDAEYEEGGLHVKTYARMTKRLEERQDYLKSLPVDEERRTWVGTGQTYKQHWRTLPEASRGAEMRSAGFELYVSKTDRVSLAFYVREYDPRVKDDHAPLGLPVADVGDRVISADSVDELLAKLGGTA